VQFTVIDRIMYSVRTNQLVGEWVYKYVELFMLVGLVLNVESMRLGVLVKRGEGTSEDVQYVHVVSTLNTLQTEPKIQTKHINRVTKPNYNP
jgi:hypothetical protein